MKVFSIKKYCEDRGCTPSDFEQEDWQVQSNGKTEEEMYRMGYATSESWMVEEPSMLVFSEELYKKRVGKDRPLTSDDWAYGLDGRSKEDIESNTYYKIDDEWCYVKTPVERFEVGKCYRYNGSKAGGGWNRKFMLPLLDNKPRLCVGAYDYNRADFEGLEMCIQNGWGWGDLSLWEEVQEPEHKTTERAICEYIVAQGDCAGVSCSGDLGYGMNKGTPCPLYEKGRYYCCAVGERAETQARMWLDEHPTVSQSYHVDISCSGRYRGDIPLWEEVPVEEAWKPKYGERVCVSNYSDFSYKAERIYIAQDGDKYVCFTKDSEENIDTMASVCTMKWNYVRQIVGKDKFGRAQEQVDNVKEKLERLEYCLENKSEYDSRVSARFVQEALKSVMDTLKVEV